MNQDNLLNQKIEEEEVTIDLADLFWTLWGKLPVILLSTALFAVAAFAGTKLLITPMYTSVTKVYVLSKQDNNSSVTYNDLQIGSQLTKDYMELVKSRPVLEKVIERLELDMKPEELKSRIGVTTQTDTRIMAISVRHEDPQEAKKIADEVREAVSVQITDIMNVDSVNMVEDASLPESPSSPSMLKNTAIGAILGFILVAGIFTILFILDDSVKTTDDVEKYLGLNVLTSVPLAEGEKRSKKVKKARKPNRSKKSARRR